MPVVAYLKNARISPRKAGVVASLVRRRTVSDALTILEHTPRRSAGLVAKTIKSAQANAEHNHGYRPDSLTIATISVSPGTRLKRWRAGAYGQAKRYQHKTSNIRIEVDGEKRSAAKPKSKAEAK
jgi:large subunit ribosomal protein L22